MHITLNDIDYDIEPNSVAYLPPEPKPRFRCASPRINAALRHQLAKQPQTMRIPAAHHYVTVQARLVSDPDERIMIWEY